jgi:hypothetical protein
LDWVLGQRAARRLAAGYRGPANAPFLDGLLPQDRQAIWAPWHGAPVSKTWRRSVRPSMPCGHRRTLTTKRCSKPGCRTWPSTGVHLRPQTSRPLGPDRRGCGGQPCWSARRVVGDRIRHRRRGGDERQPSRRRLRYGLRATRSCRPGDASGRVLAPRTCRCSSQPIEPPRSSLPTYHRAQNVSTERSPRRPSSHYTTASRCVWRARAATTCLRAGP